MDERDIIVAEIKGISYSDKMINLHIRNEKFGKLDKGLLVQVNSCLINKMKTHFVENRGVSFIFGINGYIWLTIQNGQFSSENLEKIAKFRNLIELFNDEFVSLSPELIFEVYGLVSNYKAKDLMVRENKMKLIELIKALILNARN